MPMDHMGGRLPGAEFGIFAIVYQISGTQAALVDTALFLSLLFGMGIVLILCSSSEKSVG